MCSACTRKLFVCIKSLAPRPMSHQSHTPQLLFVVSYEGVKFLHNYAFYTYNSKLWNMNNSNIIATEI
jgi:hypothetical protein